jgi:hypothetical protein
MKKLLVISFISLIFLSCHSNEIYQETYLSKPSNESSSENPLPSPPPHEPDDLLRTAINAADIWWWSTPNEDPAYYQEIHLGIVVIHLCGSTETLKEIYDYRYPDTPYDPNKAYMFTCGSENPSVDWPIHVWLIVKIVNGKVMLHKWAIGHELVWVLTLLSDEIMRANQY